MPVTLVTGILLMGYVAGERQGQGTLFSVSPDERVPSDQVCRVVEAVVGQLDPPVLCRRVEARRRGACSSAPRPHGAAAPRVARASGSGADPGRQSRPQGPSGLTGCEFARIASQRHRLVEGRLTWRLRAAWMVWAQTRRCLSHGAGAAHSSATGSGCATFPRADEPRESCARPRP